MSEYRLVMKGVVKTFPGVKALDHAQLELRPGKVMALMGENGAGKSTLMKCMFGIYKMDEGEIEYEGEKVAIPTRWMHWTAASRWCIRSCSLSRPVLWPRTSGWAATPPRRLVLSPWWTMPRCIKIPMNC